MSQEEETFQRCPHDKENPYAQISRSLIRDKSISPRCRWFLIYCLSYDNNWKISIPYFIREQDLSKDVMYAIIDEALRAGYLKRESFNSKGLKRYRYFISEEPKFKNILPCLENPDTVCPDTEKPDSTKEQLTNPQPTHEQISSPISPPSSSISDPESLREEIRRRISSTDKEFEEAWEKYKKNNPLQIQNVRAYLEKIVIEDRKVIAEEAKIKENTEIEQQRLINESLERLKGGFYDY